MTDHSYDYAFPVVRGIQAGREYYVAMVPLKVVPKIFSFNEDDVPPELRAQRSLNEGRVPELCRYILQNPDSYVFSALTASIDSDTHFEPIGGKYSSHGNLYVAMTGDIIVNDGQHRRAAITQALAEDADLGEETIAVVFFLDRGVKRAQQMFTDLNKHAVKPSPSLNVLYDHRDPKARVIREVVLTSSFYHDLVEMERSNLVERSRKLFTLSALHGATSALLGGGAERTVGESISLATSFWAEVALQFPEWTMVHEGRVKASEIRRNYLHTHGVILHAIGHLGRAALTAPDLDWRETVRKLPSVDWSKSNPDWEGRAVVLGRVKKARVNISLACNYLKQACEIPLNEADQATEQEYLAGGRAIA